MFDNWKRDVLDHSSDHDTTTKVNVRKHSDKIDRNMI